VSHSVSVPIRPQPAVPEPSDGLTNHRVTIVVLRRLQGQGRRT
jgi:hypothetical protein